MAKNYQIIFIVYTLLLTGCLSNPVIPDLSCDKTVPVEQKDIDYLLLANQMVDQLVASDSVKKLAENRRLNIYLDDLVNSSIESIDLAPIELAIRNRLKRSAKINLHKDPDQAEFILMGGFSEKFKDCNQLVNNFSLILRQTDSKQIIWSRKKSYIH